MSALFSVSLSTCLYHVHRIFLVVFTNPDDVNLHSKRSAAVLYQTFQHFASQPPLRLTWSHCLSTAEKEKAEEADFEVTMQSWRCSKGYGRVWEREVKFVRLGEPASRHILGRIKVANYHASGQLMHDDFEG